MSSVCCYRGCCILSVQLLFYILASIVAANIADNNTAQILKKERHIVTKVLCIS